ncbi:unnamed protein product [Amoebophrya sp. A120]|nr:unnamed protein product [Amoebophrya sp. A120]|eukprot:GSA120T00025736001.1
MKNTCTARFLRAAVVGLYGQLQFAAAQCGPGNSLPYPPGTTTCPASGSSKSGGKAPPSSSGSAPSGMATAGQQTSHQAPPDATSGTTAQQGAPPAPSSGSGMPTAGPGAGSNMGGSAITCTARPCGASTLGDVALVTASGTDTRSGVTFSPGENIYGPFEAGFSSQQDFILTGLGCSTGSLGYIDGGIDTYTAEQMVAYQCSITLPRVENNNYVSLLDECGGHTREYHFHERLSCLYDQAASGHSAQVGKEAAGLPDGQQLLVYGKYENRPTTPQLDACNGHFGVTPDSAGVVVYHYHVSDSAPFTIGCHGPDKNAAGEEILVTLERCRAVSSGCGASATVKSITRNKYPQSGSETVQYKTWCPCYDANGSNVDSATLPVFASSATITKSSVAGTTPTPSPSPAPAPAPTPAAAAVTTTTTTTTTLAPQNCVAAWSAYGNCTSGVEESTYTITTFPSGTGATACLYPQHATKQRPCDESTMMNSQNPSTGTCYGAWTDLNGGACTSGVKGKQYTTANDTESCPIANNTIAAEVCGTYCQGGWSAWSACEENAILCFYQVQYSATNPSTVTAVTQKTQEQYQTLLDAGTTSGLTWKSLLKQNADGTTANTACSAISTTEASTLISAGHTGAVNAYVPGKKTRSFTATQQPSGNGAACPASPETKVCNFVFKTVASAPKKTLQPTQIATRLSAGFALPACKTQAELNADTAFKTAIANGVRGSVSSQTCVADQIICTSCPTVSSCPAGVRRRLQTSTTDRELQVDVTITFTDAASASTAATAMQTDTYKTTLKTQVNSAITADSNLAAKYQVTAVTGLSAVQTYDENPTVASSSATYCVAAAVMGVQLLAFLLLQL